MVRCARADRPDMVDGDGPPSANAVAVSGSTSRSARAVWTHQPACPAGVRVDVASQSPWCGARQLRAAAGIKRRQGFGLYRGQLLGEGVDVQDRALQLVEGPFGRVHGQQLVDLGTSPSNAVSGSVAVMSNYLPTFER